MSESFGQKLRQAREAKSLSLEEVAQATFMRAHYLRALEESQLDSLPSLAQARGFIRSYAGFLGLDATELLAELPREAEVSEPPRRQPQPPPPPLADLTETQVAEIFGAIGAQLRQRRDMLGLSLDDVERHTHLQRHNLEAIETGDIDNLPSPVQARGMLSNYARFVGLDPEPLLLKFAEALQVRLASRRSKLSKKKRSSRQPEVGMPPTWRRVITPETLLSAFLTVALMAFLVWGVNRILEARSAVTPQPTAPSIAEVLLATPTITETFTPLPPSATLPAPPALTEQPTLALTPLGIANTSSGAVQLYVTVNQRAWMRVTVDGKVEFQGRVLAGSAYQFAGASQVEVLTGNAAALEVFFQERDLGPMGNFGQVVNRVYTPQGVLEPTPTITPTPSQTPLPSPTTRQTGTSANVPNP